MKLTFIRVLEIIQQSSPPSLLRTWRRTIGIKLLILLQIASSPRLQVNLIDPPKGRLEEELVRKVNDGEQRQQDIRVDKPSSIKGAEIGPTLDQRQKDVGSEPKVRIPRVP